MKFFRRKIKSPRLRFTVSSYTAAESLHAADGDVIVVVRPTAFAKYTQAAPSLRLSAILADVALAMVRDAQGFLSENSHPPVYLGDDFIYNLTLNPPKEGSRP